MSFADDPLPPRLAALARLVPAGAVVADVGCGHGRLAAHLAATGRSPRVYAIDRSPEEIRRAERHPGVTVRLGDGLAALETGDRIDVAVVAGLGGASIARIVAGAVPVPLLVLQPQTEAAELRRALGRAGYALVHEELVEEAGRTYLILAARPGPAAEPPPPAGLTPEDVVEAGPFLLRERPPALGRLWSRQRARLARIGHPRLADALSRAERILRFLDS